MHVQVLRCNCVQECVRVWVCVRVRVRAHSVKTIVKLKQPSTTYVLVLLQHS